MIINHKNKKGKKRIGDYLATPKDLFRKCENIWNVKCTLDLTANKDNTKCKKFIDEKQDFFKVEKVSEKETVWGNFPHSKQSIFVKHAFEIWINSNCQMLLLLPINTLGSNYAKKFVLPWIKFETKMILPGRPNFLDPKTGKPSKHNAVNTYVTLFYPRRNERK